MDNNITMIVKMRMISTKILSLYCFLQLIFTQSGLYSQVVPVDKIVDTVWCKSSAGQSYSLYLPLQYDRSRNWPVVLIFDPAARGKTGVRVFMEAGQKYGFILAGSNNSRNGPLENNFTAAAAMLLDLSGRFNIDPKRIYVAGFSGGSRFALSFAVKDRRISGVIGCGAGLPGDQYYLPSVNSSFLYYGLAGNRDMNYLEMHDLPAFFNNKTGIISYIRTFSGMHDWPGSDLILEAVEWIIYQSMTRKVIATDRTFILYMEDKTQKLISSQQSAGNIIDASIYMSFTARDFQGTPFGSRVAGSLSAIEKSPDYQKAVRKWNKIAQTEGQRREKYMNYLMSTVRSGPLPDSASAWWKNETRSLVWLREKGAPENSQMASRILNFISILCSEQGTSYFRNSFFTQAATFFEVCTMSDSENKNNYYNLSRAFAGAGKIKESIDALSAAVNHGFDSRKSVESDSVFVALKDNQRFREIVSKLK